MTDRYLVHDNRIVSFGIGGYRSFGAFQHIESLDKVNVFIGSNNNGKSNVLKFIEAHFGDFVQNRNSKFSDLDEFKPISSSTHQAPFLFGYPIPLSLLEPEGLLSFLQAKNQANGLQVQLHSKIIQPLCDLFVTKAKLDNSETPWFRFSNSALSFEDWEPLLRPAPDGLTNALRLFGGSGRRDSVEADLQKFFNSLFAPNITLNAPVALIPAIRNIGGTGTEDVYSGFKLIEELRSLERPIYTRQNDKEKFEKINKFIRAVTGDPISKIEIAAEADEILVHLEGRLLPIESLGTGIHEVVILASTATVLENGLVCIEEPETHLNPTLQKKLLRYLNHETSNQYFITTHSAAIIDRPSTSVYEVKLMNGESQIRKIINSGQHSNVCLDLGYKSSDIVQSNCIIWVEGPSDRIYINEWIKLQDSSLVEGIDYSIMFYGGKLLSHLSWIDIEEEDITEFIAMRSLNRRGAIVIDSDKRKASEDINETKERLQNEFSMSDSISWITEGKEIENYLDFDSIRKAASVLSPTAEFRGKNGKWKNVIEIKSAKGRITTLNKVKLARYMVDRGLLDLNAFDLERRISELCEYITRVNSD